MTDPVVLILDFQNKNTTNYGVILEGTADKTGPKWEKSPIWALCDRHFKFLAFRAPIGLKPASIDKIHKEKERYCFS